MTAALLPIAEAPAFNYLARQEALVKAGYLAKWHEQKLPKQFVWTDDADQQVEDTINPNDRNTAWIGVRMAARDMAAGKPCYYQEPAPAAEPPDLAIKAATESRCDGATIVRTIDGVVLGVYSRYQDRGFLVSNNQRDITAVLLDSPGDCINWLILSSDKDRQHYEDLVAVHDIMHGRVSFAPVTLEADMVAKLQDRRSAMSEV